MKKQTGDRLSITYFIVTVGILLSKALGFFRDVVFASEMGAGTCSDIYYGIFGIVTLVFTGIGMASSTLVIKGMNKAENGTDEGRRAYVSAFIMRASVCILLITALLYAASPLLVKALLPGLPEEFFPLALRVTYIMLPSFFFVVIAYTISGVLQNSRRFFIPSIVSLPYNVILISQLLFTDPNITAVSAATTVGWGLHIVFQLPSFYRAGYRFVYARGALGGRARIAGVRETAAIFVSNMAFQICFLIDRGLVSGDEGAVTSVNYASNLFVTVSSVFVVAMSSVAFPAISKNFEEGKLDYVRRMIGSIILSMAAIFIPFLLVTVFFGRSIVSLIWERGMFTADAAEMTAEAFVIYGFAIFGYVAEELFSKVLYLSSKYKLTVSAVGVVAILKLLTGRTAYGAFGIAGAAGTTTLFLTAYAVFITLAMRRMIGPFFTKKLAFDAGRLILSGAAATIAYFIMSAALPGLFGDRVMFLVPLAVCGVVYIAAMFLTGGVRAVLDGMRNVRGDGAD